MSPHNARILLVDDEPTLLELLGDFLREQGHEVILADTGTKGLDLYNSELPDLVLLDLKLPDLSGLDVLKHISSRDDETGLIVISGVGSTDTPSRACAGARGIFWSSPFSIWNSCCTP